MIYGYRALHPTDGYFVSWLIPERRTT